MSWLEQLPKKERRGSRPRCILFMDGDRETVAARLTELVGLSSVKVSADDKWMPYGKPVKKEDDSWDKTPAAESQRMDLYPLEATLVACIPRGEHSKLGRQYLQHKW